MLKNSIEILTLPAVWPEKPGKVLGKVRVCVDVFSDNNDSGCDDIVYAVFCFHYVKSHFLSLHVFCVVLQNQYIKRRTYRLK